MKKLVASAVLVMGAALTGQAWAAACSTSDVSIEGLSANTCVGMLDGNVNSLADINTATGGSFTTFVNGGSDGLVFNADGTFSFNDIYGDEIAIALKQNTSWAVFRFDLSGNSTGGDGVWNGLWSTLGDWWDGNDKANGCQGCGGLSHGILVSMTREEEVPVPGTLGLLGLGLAGLGLARRKQKA